MEEEGDVEGPFVGVNEGMLGYPKRIHSSLLMSKLARHRPLRMAKELIGIKRRIQMQVYAAKILFTSRKALV